MMGSERPVADVFLGTPARSPMMVKLEGQLARQEQLLARQTALLESCRNADNAGHYDSVLAILFAQANLADDPEVKRRLVGHHIVLENGFGAIRAECDFGIGEHNAFMQEQALSRRTRQWDLEAAESPAEAKFCRERAQKRGEVVDQLISRFGVALNPLSAVTGALEETDAETETNEAM
jgi:hypothetical protein